MTASALRLLVGTAQLPSGASGRMLVDGVLDVRVSRSERTARHRTAIVHASRVLHRTITRKNHWQIDHDIAEKNESCLVIEAERWTKGTSKRR